MTVVACLVEPVSNAAILVADSRISESGSSRYDVCQKVARLGTEGFFGIAGRVRTALEVGRWLTETYAAQGTGWLRSESEVLGLLSREGALGSPEPASFLVAYRDEGRVRMTRFSTAGDFQSTGFGLGMIGEGSQVYGQIRPRMTDIVNFGGPGVYGIASAQRAMFLAEMVLSACRDAGITSVGGLMQLHVVDGEHVYAIPYERWVHLGGGYGTYVQMDIDHEGGWVQKHEPTGLVAPLRFPTEDDFNDVPGQTGTNFELERDLDINSPGVEATPNPVKAYGPITTDAHGQWIVRGD